MPGSAALPVRLEGSLDDPQYSLESDSRSGTLSSKAIELDLNLPPQIQDIIRGQN